MSQVLCPVLIGRKREMETLESALTDGREGRGRLLVISGEAGVGKSRLAREAEALATQAGMRVGRGRSLSGTDHLPYRPLVEAVQSLLRGAGPPNDPALEPYRRMLGGLVPEWADRRGTAPESELALAEAVLRLVQSIAIGRGLFLVLEDLHWADADTLSIVEYLADNLSTERVLCVCTERSGWPGPAADRLASLVARRSAERITLTRLADEEVIEMASCSIGVDAVSQAVANALTKRSEGLPFLVEEMLSAYLDLGGPGSVHRNGGWLSKSRKRCLPRTEP